MNASARLIVVSNRLPMTIDSKDDERTLHPSSGGLISALTPILKNSGGYRVGWKAYDDALPELIAYWAVTPDVRIRFADSFQQNRNKLQKPNQHRGTQAR
jgi:trehalose-6-phosphate synthase